MSEQVQIGLYQHKSTGNYFMIAGNSDVHFSYKTDNWKKRLDEPVNTSMSIDQIVEQLPRFERSIIPQKNDKLYAGSPESGIMVQLDSRATSLFILQYQNKLTK